MATYNGPPVGNQYTLDSPVAGSSGGFFESVTQGIDAFGKLAGIGLNTYASVRTVKASTAQPERTYDQEYVRDIAGQPVAYPRPIVRPVAPGRRLGAPPLVLPSGSRSGCSGAHL